VLIPTDPYQLGCTYSYVVQLRVRSEFSCNAGPQDGYITAPSWKGPYTMHSMVGDSKSPAVEDPFVWQDKVRKTSGWPRNWANFSLF
jgi:hypothetical protein